MKLISLLFLPIFGFGQATLDTTITLLNDKVEILVPKELSKMSAEMWTLKYHDLPRPELVLTDENGEINFLVNLTQQPAEGSQIAAYKDFRISNLKKTRTDIIFLGDGIKNVNGRNIGFIKFLSQASDQNVFNFFFFTVADGKILFFTFNCIEKLQKTGEKAADDILNSIKVK